MGLKTFVAAGIVLLSSVTASSAASVFNQIVVFGDSLSDNGNAAAALGGQFAYNGNSNYAPNAATDGPNTTPAVPSGGPYGVWVDQLAAKVGVPDPQPIVANIGGTVVPNFAGTNFAVASALAGSNPSFNLATFTTSGAVPYTTDQIGIFNAYNAHNGTLPNASALYAFWAGGDNILGLSSPLAAADSVMSNIQMLAGEGGKYFLWVNLPDLGAIPVTSGNPLLSAAATLASDAYNAEYALDIAQLGAQGITVIPVDVNSLFSSIALNTTTSAQGLSGVDPNQYAFWDGLHPTTEADSYIAGLAAADVAAAGLTSALASTPEPATLGVASLGVFALAFFHRRRKQQS